MELKEKYFFGTYFERILDLVDTYFLWFQKK